MLVYTYLTLRLLKQCFQDTNGASASIERVSLNWLWNLTIGFGSFVLLTLLYVIWLRLGLMYSRSVDALVLIAMAGMIYAIGYQTLRQPEIFSGPPALKSAPKYEKSTLTPGRAEAYVAKLTQVMEKEKLHRNSSLKLQDLAQRLDALLHLSCRLAIVVRHVQQSGRLEEVGGRGAYASRFCNKAQA
jgi:hypothetical protein